MAPINYAQAYGIHSLAAAIIFAVLYLPLIGFYAFQLFRSPVYINIMLTLFCTIRCVSYIIRGVLSNSESAGENLDLLIADQVLFGVGFFALLYTAYNAVLDRENLVENHPPKPRIMQIVANRHLFRLVLIAAVALGITGSTKASSSSQDDRDSALTFRTASSAIFLVMTALQAFQTVLLVKNTRMYGRIRYRDTFGDAHADIIFCIISVLLLVREVFATATVRNSSEANNEHFWYPLQALPEFLCVCFYMAPGLIPSKQFYKEVEDKKASIGQVGVGPAIPLYNARSASP